MTRDLPTLGGAKQQAKRLREEAAARGEAMGHARALEVIAQSFGFRDWNALHAVIRDRAPEGWQNGGRVQGTYLSQPFTATVRSAEPQRAGWFRLVLDLDEAVDVVRFDSFSNLRKQIRVLVGPDGRSQERTSDGAPHLVLEI